MQGFATFKNNHVSWDTKGEHLLTKNVKHKKDNCNNFCKLSTVNL